MIVPFSKDSVVLTFINMKQNTVDLFEIKIDNILTGKSDFSISQNIDWQNMVQLKPLGLLTALLIKTQLRVVSIIN